MSNQNQDMLLLQYQLSVKNIEYLDGYTPKSLALFTALTMGLAATAEQSTALKDNAEIVSLIVLAVGIFVVYLISRVSYLARLQKENLKRIEQLFPDGEITSPIPEEWGRKWATSRVSQIVVMVLSLIGCGAVLVAKHM